jgi:hypothetical protein
MVKKMIMTKEEVQSSSRIWAANGRSPIDRDTQILIMKTAAWRHQQVRNKYKEILEKKGKDHDPLG